MSAGGVFQEKEARSSEPAAFPQPPRADDSGDLALHGLAAHAPRSRCGKVGAVQHPAESRALSGILNIECTRIVGRVLGVVSEADIILKAASRPESAGMLGRFFTPKAVDERHLAATTAGEAMTLQP